MKKAPGAWEKEKMKYMCEGARSDRRQDQQGRGYEDECREKQTEMSGCGVEEVDGRWTWRR